MYIPLQPKQTCEYSQSPPNKTSIHRGGSSTAHSTTSQRKFDEYFTPEILEKVKQAYAMDYEVLDDLKRRPPGAVASGRDLKIVKESCPSPEEQN